MSFMSLTIFKSPIICFFFSKIYVYPPCTVGNRRFYKSSAEKMIVPLLWSPPYLLTISCFPWIFCVKRPQLSNIKIEYITPSSCAICRSLAKDYIFDNRPVDPRIIAISFMLVWTNFLKLQYPYITYYKAKQQYLNFRGKCVDSQP